MRKRAVGDGPPMRRKKDRRPLAVETATLDHRLVLLEAWMALVLRLLDVTEKEKLEALNAPSST